MYIPKSNLNTVKIVKNLVDDFKILVSVRKKMHKCYHQVCGGQIQNNTLKECATPK